MPTKLTKPLTRESSVLVDDDRPLLVTLNPDGTLSLKPKGRHAKAARTVYLGDLYCQVGSFSPPVAAAPGPEYPKEIQVQLDTHDRNRHQIIALAERCELIARMLEGDGLSEKVSINCSNYFVSLHMLDPDRTTITTVLRGLAAIGFRQTCQPTNQDKHTRVWHCGEVTVFASFYSGASCQMVQVGETTEPVYELRCGGDEVAP